MDRKLLAVGGKKGKAEDQTGGRKPETMCSF